ncbi:MAG TPA: aldo/keto reductase [Mycobacteriales bacterium]|nr:aldo/keto reductase [Mycobacteriales bacterium]
MTLPARVGPLGLGCAPFGNLYREITDEQAAETFRTAWDLGVRLFDVAPHYGLGLAERRLGRLLTGVPRADVIVSTKVGRLLEPYPDGRARPDAEGFAVRSPLRRVRDYSADGVRRSVESSLDRLGLDRLDIALVHDPDEHVEQALTGALPALAQLRAEGVVGAIGVGMNQVAGPERFVRESDVDVLLVAGRWTLLDRSAGATLFPLCQQRGVSVLLGGVLNSGLLGQDHPDGSATYDYRPAARSVLERAAAFAAASRRHGLPLARAATAFAARHPAVTSVLIGARTPDEVRAAHTALTEPIPARILDDIAAARPADPAAARPGDQAGPRPGDSAADDRAAARPDD